MKINKVLNECVSYIERDLNKDQISRGEGYYLSDETIRKVNECFRRNMISYFSIVTLFINKLVDRIALEPVEYQMTVENDSIGFEWMFLRRK